MGLRLRFLPLLLTLLCGVLFPLSAFAQATVTIDPAGFRIWRAEERATSEEQDTINRKDCLDDDPNEEEYNDDTGEGLRTWIEMSVGLRNTTTRSSLQVWASRTADCSKQDERATDGNCKLVHDEGNANSLVVEMRVRPRHVVDQSTRVVDELEPLPGEEVCNTEKDEALVLWILLFDGTDADPAFAKWEYSRIDTRAPAPPSVLNASGGNETIFLDWSVDDADDEDDTYGFAYYCAPATVGPATGLGGDSGSDRDTCDDGGAFDDLDLTSDEARALLCGTVIGRTARDGQTNSLGNGQTYAVAVASTDTVKNVGRLSSYNCATPQEVNTFFSGYKDAGGKGGGGFCSISSGPQTSTWLLLLSALSLWLLRRRRARCLNGAQRGASL